MKNQYGNEVEVLHKDNYSLLPTIKTHWKVENFWKLDEAVSFLETLPREIALGAKVIQAEVKFSVVYLNEKP